VAVWKAHDLAGEQGPQLVLNMHDKVVAKRDLRDVPQGTAGVVILTGGFSWRRYRVKFANGAEIGFLDIDDIAPAKRGDLQN
jgi:hypothetical protein